MSPLFCILLPILFDFVWSGGRILNGYPIDIEHAPYMAFITISVGNGLETFCSGSIVNEQFILTAGHCK